MFHHRWCHSRVVVVVRRTVARTIGTIIVVSGIGTEIIETIAVIAEAEAITIGNDDDLKPLPFHIGRHPADTAKLRPYLHISYCSV